MHQLLLLLEVGKLRLREVTGQLRGGRAGTGTRKHLTPKPGVSSTFLAWRGWVLPMGRPAPGERRRDAGTSSDALRGLGAEPAPRRGDGTAHTCRRLYCFAGEQGQGRMGGIPPSLHLPHVVEESATHDLGDL